MLKFTVRLETVALMMIVHSNQLKQLQIIISLIPRRRSRLDSLRQVCLWEKCFHWASVVIDYQRGAAAGSTCHWDYTVLRYRQYRRPYSRCRTYTARRRTPACRCISLAIGWLINPTHCRSGRPSNAAVQLLTPIPAAGGKMPPSPLLPLYLQNCKSYGHALFRHCKGLRSSDGYLSPYKVLSHLYRKC